MNAAVVTAYDVPPRYASFADPVAAEGDVLVNVTAAGLHPIVKALANGTHYGSSGVFPFIPGVDGAGKLDDGTRVYFGAARSPFGTFAERCVTMRSFCVSLPEGLDETAAAGIANPGMSSWVALKLRAQLVPGDNLLVLGATGVAGRLSVQVAKRLGAKRVIAVGRNPDALEELKRLGADSVISLHQERDALLAAFRQEWKEDKVDVVLDYLWGSPAETLLAAISQKGLQNTASRIRYVQVGASAGAKISFSADVLRSSKLEMLGSGFGSASMPQIFQALAEFFAAAAKSPFQFRIKTAPLRDVESLWNSGEHNARLVFQP